MTALIYIMIFIISIFLAHFITKIIYRLPKKEEIFFKKSYCTKCGRYLKTKEQIPIASYMFLGGECKRCQKPIDKKYIVLEIVTLGIFVIYALSIGINLNSNIQTWLGLVLGAIYIYTIIAIAGIDGNKKRINKMLILIGMPTLLIYRIVAVVSIESIILWVILLVVFFVICGIKKTRKKYIYEIILLLLYMAVFSGISLTILTLIFVFLVILTKYAYFQLIGKEKAVDEFNEEKRKANKKKTKNLKFEVPKFKLSNIHFGIYICTFNIIAILIANFLNV